MTATLNASTSAGVILTSDTSGSLAIQSNGTTVLTASSSGVSLPSGTVAINGPAFSVYSSGSQSISNTTWTKIQFNNKVFDTNNNFDATTNYRFTPSVAGYYQVNALVALNTMTGASEIAIYKNGSVVYYGTYPITTSAAPNFNSISGLVYLNGTTDYIEIYIYQSSGGSVTTSASGSAYVWFNGSMVRSA